MADKDKDTDRILDDLIRGKNPEEILGQNGILKQLTKRLVERALEAEMTTHLGYEKHSVEGHNTGNSRNGKTSKTVTTETGEIAGSEMAVYTRNWTAPSEPPRVGPRTRGLRPRPFMRLTSASRFATPTFPA